MKKQLSLLLVPIYLASCVSSQVVQAPNEAPVVNLFTSTDFEYLKLSECAESNVSRKPSAETKCVSFYEKDIAAEKAAPATIAQQISGRTREIEQFGQTENFGLWTLVLGADRVRELVAKPRANRLNPVELISDKEIKSISLAWRTLRDIPNNKFTLSESLLVDINKLLMGDVETSVIQELNSRVLNEAQKKTGVGKLRSDLAKYFNAGPGLRKKASREEYEEVTEEAYNNYRQNAEAAGAKVNLAEDSNVNQRVFTIEAPRGEQLKSAITNIFEDANRRMPEVANASYSEKVSFIADLHLKLVAIQPMAKLNDMTVQMLINRTLIQVGLDPSVRISIDLSMSREQVAEIYRNSIADYLSFTQKSFELEINPEGTLVAKNEAVSITGRGAGLRVKITGKYAKKYPNAAALMRDISQVTPLDNRAVQLGRDRRTYVLKDDGFLYDGIVPHTIRNEDGKLKLYPITDAVYRLLGLNGDHTGEVGVRRNITGEHQALLRQNLMSIENLLQNNIKSEDIEVVYDKAAIEANKTGSLYLYKWQTGIVERAAKIKEDPKENPYAILVPGRGDPVSPAKAGIFSFEAAYMKNSRGIKIGDLIGQYEQKDLDYNQFARQVKANSTLSEAKKQKILADIMDSRRKLHAAAREILRPFLTKYATLSPKELKELRDNATFFQLEDYLRNFSKLAYETLEQGFEKLGDDYVYRHRLQPDSLTRTMGFRTQTDFKDHPAVKVLTLNGLLVPQLREIMTAMQTSAEAQALESGSIGKVIAQKIAAIAKGNKKVEGILTTVVLRVYGKRAADIQNVQEFESMFMDHYLLAVNRGMKKGISTTADPTYLAMVKSYEEYVFESQNVKSIDGLIALFKEFKKDSKDPVVDAQRWLVEMATKEKRSQLPLEYYELGWVSGFAKEFNIPLEKAIEVSNKEKVTNDKFTTQDDGVIYVLRIPVNDLSPNYASGYVAMFKGQFEDTTNRGWGVISSKWGVFKRPLISREYKYSRKFGVDLADISESGREVLDMSRKHIESKADFTPYVVYSADSMKHLAVSSGLLSTNKKTVTQSIKDLASLKYDLQTLKTESDVEGFKQVIEQVFNTAIKAIESNKDVDSRKAMLTSLTVFLKEHSLRDERIAGWAIELWEGVVPVKGKEAPAVKVGNDVVRKAKSEISILKAANKVPTEEVAAN